MGMITIRRILPEKQSWNAKICLPTLKAKIQRIICIGCITNLSAQALPPFTNATYFLNNKRKCCFCEHPVFASCGRNKLLSELKKIYSTETFQFLENTDRADYPDTVDYSDNTFSFEDFCLNTVSAEETFSNICLLLKILFFSDVGKFSFESQCFLISNSGV